MHTYVTDPKFSSVLLKVKDQTGVNSLFVDKSDPNFISINIDGKNGECTLHAKQLLELKFKHQQKLFATENRLRKTQEELFSTQGNVASGLIVEFEVPTDCIGLIIGKKGMRIRQIEEETGVQSIKVNDNEHTGKGRVVIVGKDTASVKRARELMEVNQESHNITEAHMQYFKRGDGRNFDRTSMLY